MIHIIFLILKILGLILLVFLGLIICIAALVLFVPLRYKAEGKRYEKFQGKARITWLFRIFAIHAEFDEELHVTVRIFGFPLKKKQPGLKKEQEQTDEQEKEPIKKEPEESLEPDVHIASVEDVSEDFSYGGEDQTLDEIQTKKNVRQKKGRGKIRKILGDLRNKASEAVRRVRKIAERLWKTWTKIEDKAEKIRNIIGDKENQELFFLVAKQVKSLLVYVFPKRIKGKIYIGFEDPYTTGQAMAIAGLLCPVYKESLDVIPSFEEPVLEGELNCSGRIRIFGLLVIGGRLVLNKKFRYLIKKLLDLR